MQQDKTKSNHHFLQGGGEMGELTQNFNWEKTPLGHPDQWPQSLRTTVGIILHSAFPMFLFWGDELTCFYNDAFRPSLGINGKHPALGKKGKEVWEEIWEFIGPLISKVMTTGEAVWFEDQPVPFYRNGRMEDIYWTFSYSPAYGDDGKISGVIVTCTETTKHVEARKDLFENEQNLRNVIAQAPVAMSLFRGPEFKIQMANSRALDFWGKKREHVMGRNLMDAIPEVQGQGFVELLRGVYETGKTYTAFGKPITLIRNGKAEIAYVNFSYQAYREEDGTISGIMSASTEVTKEIIAQQKLEESEQRFRIMAENTDILIAISDETSSATYFNKAWEDFTGRSEKELLDFGWADLIHEDDREIFLDLYLEAFENKQAWTGEFRILNKSGDYRWLLSKGALRFNTDGSFAGYISSSLNITGRKNAERVMEENEYRYRTLIEEATIATALYTGSDLKVQYANNIMLNYWGKDASVIGKPLREALPELVGQPFLGFFEEVYRTGVPYVGTEEEAYLFVDGRLQPFYYNYVYKALRNKTGEIYGIHQTSIDVTAEVLAKKALNDSEQEIRSLVESAPFPIGVYRGREMRVVLANQAILDIWGKGNNVIGQLFSEVLPELDNQEVFKQLDEVFNTGIPFHIKNQRLDLIVDGKVRPYYFNYSLTPLFDGEGTIYGVMNTGADVTELNFAKRAVEESERNLRSTILQAPVAMCIFKGLHHVVEIANDRMFELWGKSGEIILNKPIFEGLPEAKEQGFEDILQNVYVTGKTFAADAVPITLPRNGKIELVYVNFVYEAFREADGSVSGILAVATDVTQQVVARKKIEEAESSLRGAIDLANLGTWSIDLETRTLDYDDRLRKWFGFSQDEIITVEKAYSPILEADRPLVQAAILHAVTPGTNGLYDVEYHITNLLNGSERILHAQGKTFFNEKNDAIKLTGTVQDVTKERKVELELKTLVQQRTEELAASNEELQATNEEVSRTNEELEEANQSLQRSNDELEQFAYIASHDLQEPVRKITTFSQMLETSLGTLDPKSKGYLDKINSSAERMTALIRDVLAYSQVARMTDEFQIVDLNKIVHDVKMDFELLIEQKGAIIEISDLPVIKAIPLQMSQLFNNLTSNSLKYIRQGVKPIIKVSASKLSKEDLKNYTHLDLNKSYYNVEFRDNGIGFDQEHADRIFNIFQRLHGKTEFEGTGIGLSLCKKVMQNHQGDIRATASTKEGAVFNIIIPDR